MNLVAFSLVRAINSAHLQRTLDFSAMLLSFGFHPTLRSEYLPDNGLLQIDFGKLNCFKAIYFNWNLLQFLPVKLIYT